MKSKVYPKTRAGEVLYLKVRTTYQVLEVYTRENQKKWG